MLVAPSFAFIFYLYALNKTIFMLALRYNSFSVLVFFSFGFARLNYVALTVCVCVCQCAPSSHSTNLDHNNKYVPFICRFFLLPNKQTREKKNEFNNSYYNRTQFTLLFVSKQHLNDICSASGEEKKNKLKNSKLFPFHVMKGARALSFICTTSTAVTLDITFLALRHGFYQILKTTSARRTTDWYARDERVHLPCHT